MRWHWFELLSDQDEWRGSGFEGSGIHRQGKRFDDGSRLSDVLLDKQNDLDAFDWCCLTRSVAKNTCILHTR